MVKIIKTNLFLILLALCLSALAWCSKKNDQQNENKILNHSEIPANNY